MNLSHTLAAEEEKLLACVHCGLCLEACPTYTVTANENDSPRGRLYLMRAVEEGRLAAASTTFERHINRCLGCRACEQACPAGVRYGELLEAARSELQQAEKRRSWTSWLLRLLLRHIWLHPTRLRAAFSFVRAIRDARIARLLLKLRLARLISSSLEFALALLDSSSPSSLSTRTTGPTQTVGASGRLKAVPGRDERRENESSLPFDKEGSRVLLFKGCVTEGLFARINRATARVLAVNGCTSEVPATQVCCGALHAHAGDLEGARVLARRNIEAFTDERDAPVITNAGGCGAMLASYAHLLEEDAEYAGRAIEFSERVRDVSQELSRTSLRHGASLDRGLTVTYDASCHLLYGQGAREEPLRLLAAIPDLEAVPLAESERCCGGAGVYNLLEPELSRRVLDEKLRHLKETGANVLATGNPGCHMQIGAGARLGEMRSLKICHPVELLDESYARAGFYQAPNSDE